MFKLVTSDKDLNEDIKVKKYLEDVENKLKKIKVKAEYHTLDNSIIVEDTLENHYTKMDEHMLMYGTASVKFLPKEV